MKFLSYCFSLIKLARAENQKYSLMLAEQNIFSRYNRTFLSKLKKTVSNFIKPLWRVILKKSFFYVNSITAICSLGLGFLC